MPKAMIKVLVVDDSALMRRQLKRIFSSAGDFEVMTARDGQDALEQIKAHQPDVVTLDIHMPVMDGLTCLSHIMTETPLPVVMVSSLTERGALATFEALELGAIDYIQKPDGTVSADMEKVQENLLAKVRVASGARVSNATANPAVSQDDAQPQPESQASAKTRTMMPPAMPGEMGVVIIGVSTGGPRTLENILPSLPADFPWPVVIAQHMPASFTGVFAKRLNQHCPLEVCEVQGMKTLSAGHIYIGRGDADVVLSSRGSDLKVMPVPESPDSFWHPSVERLVASAMKAMPVARIAGVMLTGMGDDGAQAMSRLRNGGGFTIAESEASSVVWGMPKALIDLDGASVVLPAEAVAAQLCDYLQPAALNSA